jgi:hypothetical protein
MKLIEANEDHKLEHQSDDREFHSWEKSSLRNVEDKRSKKIRFSGNAPLKIKLLTTLNEGH